MAGPRHRSGGLAARPAHLLALGLLAAGLTAGCGGDRPDNQGLTPAPSSTPSGVGGIGGPGPAPTSAPPSAKPPAPSYPTTPRPYAQAVLAEWKAKDLPGLARLTTDEVHEQLLEIPAPVNHSWTYIRCDGTAGSSYCAFFNATGDEIVLRVTHTRLGRSDAVGEVRFASTEYPDDGEEYVEAFLAAWRNGNQPRMTALATPATVAALGGITAPTAPSLASVSGGAGLQIVTVTGAGGFVIELHVGTTLLGDPHAIVGVDL